MNTLVCAACNEEDTSWTKELPSAFSENGWIKSIDTRVRPHGREATVYLDYIASHYNEISPKDTIVFAQGDPFAHDKDFLEHLKDPSITYFGYVTSCSPNGSPHCDWTPLHAWSDILKLPLREEYKFIAGAQYRVTGQQIKLRSHDFYKALYYLTLIPNNKSAWVCERLYPQMWELEL